MPGNSRNRIKRLIDGLAREPRPPESAALIMAVMIDRTPELHEARRLRLDHWRVVYLVSDAEAWVTVVAIRRRPPYDYGDLVSLTSG